MRLLPFLLQNFPHAYTCVICGNETFESDFFCKRCKGRLSAITDRFCPRCGRRTVADGLCLACKDDPPAFDAARAAFDYIPPESALVKTFKFDNRPYLGKVLAPFLAKTWNASSFSADVVTFVPMTGKQTRKRGYNQARLLAEETAALIGLPFRPLVVKEKESRTQHELTRAERLQNLSGCFHLAPGAFVKGLTVLIIDDVITTGSTLGAIAKLLKRHGAARVYGLTFAATPDPAVRLLMEKGLFPTKNDPSPPVPKPGRPQDPEGDGAFAEPEPAAPADRNPPQTDAPQERETGAGIPPAKTP